LFTLSAIFRGRIFCIYVGDNSGFSNNSGTTISGILSSIEEALKITNDIVDKLRDSGCFAYDN
jgi:hypothetical protein